jgi:hypothetical protein
MTIDGSDKLIAALQALTREQVAALPPAERRRLCEALEAAHRIAATEAIIADAKSAFKSGVLRDLTKDGRGRQ